LDAEELKQVGGEMMAAIIAFGIKHKSRSEIRSTIVDRLRGLDGYDSTAKRFIGDHVMALFGYGGGIL
jgi:hypothetical protein